MRVADGEASVTWHATAEVDPDPDVVAAYRDRRRALGLDEVVTTVDGPVERRASRGESAVGNFVADALRHAADAHVGLMHGGGIRDADPLDGDVTVGDLVSLVPFDNEVFAVEVPGDRLLDAFRASPALGRDRDEPRWFGQVSGAEVVWDQAAADLRAARVGGDPVDPTDTYTLATIDYVLRPAGLFESLDRSLPLRSVGTIHDLLVDHARAHGIPTEPAGRIERLNLPDPG